MIMILAMHNSSCITAAFNSGVSYTILFTIFVHNITYIRMLILFSEGIIYKCRGNLFHNLDFFFKYTCQHKIFDSLVRSCLWIAVGVYISSMCSRWWYVCGALTWRGGSFSVLHQLQVSRRMYELLVKMT